MCPSSEPEKQATSTRKVARFEAETLSAQHYLTALMKLSGRWIDVIHRLQPVVELILYMDSSASET